MSKFDVKVPTNSVQSVDEFDAILEAYKEKNPAKFAAKLASGDFDRFRATLPQPIEEKKKK